MAIINLTPHKIHIYLESDFVNLVQQNATTFVADGINEGVTPIAVFEPKGNARITVTTEDAGIKDGIPFVKSTYGELVGIPEGVKEGDILIVSLPTKSNALASNHLLASQMVSPYKVVRDAVNTSNVLGAVGLSY